MTASLLPVPRIRFLDGNGNPLDGGKLYTYEAGTSTPKASYVDSTAVTENTNPIILNELGEASIWISGNYKINLTDADDVQVDGFPVDNVQDLHTADNVTATSTTSLSVSAASKTFTTQTGKYFPAGIFLLAVDDAAPSTNWMHGQVTAYVGTQLTINVTTATGSGTHADWTISLSGPVGPQGSTGSPGAGTGDVVGPASVTTSRIALFDGTSGKLIKQHTGGAGSAASLDVGTSANQIVQLTAAAKLPAVDGSLLTGLVAAQVSGVASGATLISTQSASGTAIDFTSIAATYRQLLLVWTGITMGTNSRSLIFQTSQGSGFGSMTSYYKKITNTATTDNVGTTSIATGTSQSTIDTSAGYMRIDIYNSLVIKPFDAYFIDWFANGPNYNLVQGYITSTAAIDGIRCKLSGTGSFTAGSFSLYGIA